MNMFANQKGASIIAVIAVMLILAVMGATLISLVTTGSDVSVNQLQSEQAFNVAEGGKEYILANRTFPNYSTQGVTINLGVIGSSSNFKIDTPAYLTTAGFTALVPAAGGTFTVNSTAGFPSPGSVVIDNEIITVTISNATTFTVTARGAGGTTAAAHAQGNAVYPVTTVSDNPLGVAVTTINVASTTGFVIPGVIKIESEYTYCASTPTATSFGNCIRGYKNTTPAVHAMNSNVFQYIITSTGTVGNAQRVVRIAADRIGGNAITNGTFDSDISGWAETLTNTDGSSAWSNYPTTGGSPGSLLAQTNTGRGLNFTGYRSQGISIASGTNVTFQIDYCKNATGDTGGGSRMDTSVVIVYQGGATYTVWSDTLQPTTTCSNKANWPATVNTSFATTNNVVEVRIVYDLRNRSGPSGDGTKKEVWFDNVSLTSPGGPGALTWQESY